MLRICFRHSPLDGIKKYTWRLGYQNLVPKLSFWVHKRFENLPLVCNEYRKWSFSVFCYWFKNSLRAKSISSGDCLIWEGILFQTLSWVGYSTFPIVIVSIWSLDHDMIYGCYAQTWFDWCTPLWNNFNLWRMPPIQRFSRSYNVTKARKVILTQCKKACTCCWRQFWCEVVDIVWE